MKKNIPNKNMTGIELCLVHRIIITNMNENTVLSFFKDKNREKIRGIKNVSARKPNRRKVDSVAGLSTNAIEMRADKIRLFVS